MTQIIGKLEKVREITALCKGRQFFFVFFIIAAFEERLVEKQKVYFITIQNVNQVLLVFIFF